MNITDDEIMDTYRQRINAQGVIFNRMRAAKDAYNCDNVVLISDLDKSQKPVTANTLKQAADQISMLIGGVSPMMDWPALKPHIDKSVATAADRRMAAYGWWEANQIPKKIRRRARHYSVYGVSYVSLRPNMAEGIPRWDVRNPLTTYPSPMVDPDEIVPANVIFAYAQTMGWVKARYEAEFQQLKSPNTKPSDPVEIVEYYDADEVVLLATAKPVRNFDDLWLPAGNITATRTVRIETVPNLTGRPWVVSAGRITLDRMMGQFDGILTSMELEARMMALEVIAVERGIFPDMALFGFPNSSTPPTLVNGDWKDGRSGEINIIQNGDVKTIQMNPGVYTQQIIDRLHGSIMQDANLPSQMVGQAPSTVRTNVQGNSIVNATINPTVAEAQAILGPSLQEENKIAVAIAKAYFGDTAKSFYVSSRTAKGYVDYTPNVTFETDNNVVTYPLSGTDAQNLTIGIESLVGAELMSKKTGRFNHPMIDDPHGEEVQITVEHLDASGLALIDQAAQQGTLEWDVYADIIDAVEGKQMSVAQALLFANTEKQKRQAAAAAQAPPPGAPEGQPGAAANPGIPTVPPPGAGTQNVADILSALHRQPSNA